MGIVSLTSHVRFHGNRPLIGQSSLVVSEARIIIIVDSIHETVILVSTPAYLERWIM